MELVECKECGWQSWECAREFAEREVALFNEMYEKLPAEKKQELYHNENATIRDYERCMMCGGSYKNFKAATKPDQTQVITVGAVIARCE